MAGLNLDGSTRHKETDLDLCGDVLLIIDTPVTGVWLACDAVCVCEGGSSGGGGAVAVNGCSVSSASVTTVTTPPTPTVIPAPIAVTTFPVQQQPALIDPSLLHQYPGNTSWISYSVMRHGSSVVSYLHCCFFTVGRIIQKVTKEFRCNFVKTLGMS